MSSPFVIWILNGPNLNLLGTREPEIYGKTTLQDIRAMCEEHARELGCVVGAFRQTNHEGELVDWIQESRGIAQGLMLNAAAYTHTSLAILDALKAVGLPVVEVHLSDPATREPFRHHSYVALAAIGEVKGLGAQSYIKGMELLLAHLESDFSPGGLFGLSPLCGYDIAPFKKGRTKV